MYIHNIYVYFPVKDITEIEEGGNNISGVKDIQFVKIENDNAIFTVDSGNYSFESQLKLEFNPKGFN